MPHILLPTYCICAVKMNVFVSGILYTKVSLLWFWLRRSPLRHIFRHVL